VAARAANLAAIRAGERPLDTAADPHQSHADKQVDQDRIDQRSPATGIPADQDDPLAKLTAALLALSPADRERLAAMLAGY
jgi:hypothetical protein